MSGGECRVEWNKMQPFHNKQAGKQEIFAHMRVHFYTLHVSFFFLRIILNTPRECEARKKNAHIFQSYSGFFKPQKEV